MVEPASGAGDVSSEEAAKLLHVSNKFVDNLVVEGKLPGVRDGQSGRFRIPRASVLAFKEELKAAQKKGLDRMVEASERMGLYDAELEGMPDRRKD
jgi:excisionase family DNA binding protein